MSKKDMIVVIEDDPFIVDVMGSFAEVANKTMVGFNGAEEIEIEALHSAELIFLDLQLNNEYGVDLVKVFSENGVTTPVIICSGMDSGIINASKELLADYGLSCAGVLSKPFTLEQFIEVLQLDLSEVNPAPTVPQDCYMFSEEDIQESLKKNYIKLVYQPQVNPLTRTLTGVECLARISHPVHGLCAPNQFIQQVADSGLMNEFTKHVISVGISELLGASFPSSSVISFNLDPRTINEDFCNWLHKKITETQVNPKQICLEVTELSGLAMTKEVKSLLTKLRIHGVYLSLDDFGTGFGTIQELNELPFNELKIDRSFVMSMDAKDTSLAIVNSTIKLSLGLNYRLVAEGVETFEQMKTLLDLGCEEMQGYLFSRPINIEHLIEFLKDTQNKIKERITPLNQ